MNARLPLLPPWSRLDLHVHSNASDGRYSVDEVLRMAAGAGLDVLAITDHDLPAQAPAGRVVLGGQPLHVLHGVELSGVHRGVELHLLVYFPGEMPAEFRAFCTGLAAARAERYERAREAIGLDVPAADEAAMRGERALTRLHLARALVEAGHARNLGDAFDRYTGARHGKVPSVALSFRDAIAISKAHGGLTSWAHPSVEQAKAWTRELASMGLQGMEVLRPGLGRQTRKTLSKLARKHDLLITGGSDFHGWSPQRLGQFSVQAQQATAFTAQMLA